MTDKPTPNSGDAVPIRTAAALLDLTPNRIGQLIRGGHAVSPGRGLVNLSTLLRGYTALLRAEAARPASAALAAHQAAKASIIAEQTAQRRADLTLRKEAEEVVGLIATAAIRSLRVLAKPGASSVKALDPAPASAIRAEAAAVIAKVEEARAAALTAMATGDLSKIEGKAN